MQKCVCFSNALLFQIIYVSLLRISYILTFIFIGKIAYISYNKYREFHGVIEGRIYHGTNSTGKKS